VLYDGHINRSGYGWKYSADIGTKESAHRWAWRIQNGPIPEGLNVLHRCDTKPCINTDHLFLGTQADNMIDMESKGRGVHPQLPGERNPSARLTEQQVLDIRSDPRSHSVVAADYGVCKATIAHARSGRNWRHLCA